MKRKIYAATISLILGFMFASFQVVLYLNYLLATADIPITISNESISWNIYFQVAAVVLLTLHICISLRYSKRGSIIISIASVIGLVLWSLLSCPVTTVIDKTEMLMTISNAILCFIAVVVEVVLFIMLRRNATQAYFESLYRRADL